MDGDDPRVSRHPAHGAGLAQEAPLLRVTVQFAFVDLDRDQPIQRLLAGLPDGCEAATGDCAPIRQQNLRWEQGQPREPR